MSKGLASPLVAAVVGGGVTAAVLLGTGLVDRGSTTVIRQSPLALSASPASGDGPTASDIYKRDAPGVVFIEAKSVKAAESALSLPAKSQDAPGVTTGSGFVTDEEGHILTNAHVVEGSSTLKVTFSDRHTVDAKVVGKDTSTDLALLKVDPEGLPLRPLVLGDSNSIHVGDTTVAMGNPDGLDRTLTTGVVSALHRRLRASDGFTIDDVIQTDAAIDPGYSGGPLLDAAGQVIGINSQIATDGSAGGVGFAVPINTAKRVLPELLQSGRVQRAYLGIVGRTIDDSLSAYDVPADRGALVEKVPAGTPADKAGIRGGDTAAIVRGESAMLGGDVIQAFGGEDVESMEDVTRLLERRKPGDVVAVELVRKNGDRATVHVRLSERPSQAPER